MTKTEFCLWGIAAILGVCAAILWLVQPTTIPDDIWLRH